MDSSQNNVNKNISLAQFSFNVHLMDSYSTDYYELSYPGLIMRVKWSSQSKLDDQLDIPLTSWKA